VSIALAHRSRPMQFARRVPDDVVDHVVGEGLEGAFDVAVGFALKVVLDDPVDRLRREGTVVSVATLPVGFTDNLANSWMVSSRGVRSQRPP
jgi:hypothetical protein